MKKTILLIILIILAPKTILGQYRLQSNVDIAQFNNIDQEKVFIHYNDNFLLSGEYLYYKMYCLNAIDHSPSKISKIGYVELVGRNKKTVFKHKIRLNEGLGQGDFFIPGNLETGNYKLIGYTNWMRNSGVDSFFITDIVIVNPYKELPTESNKTSANIIYHTTIDSANINTQREDTNSIKIVLPRKIYNKRALVKLNITNQTLNQNTNLSVSVRKKYPITTPFNNDKSINIKKAPKNNLSKKIDETIFLPELRGELISGKIINNTNKQVVANQNISLSIRGTTGTTKISQSNKNGVFYFNLDNRNRSNKIEFSLLDNQNDTNQIILDTSKINTNTLKYLDIDLAHNLNKVIEKRSTYNQIENVFFEEKLDSLIRFTSTIPIYKIYDENYNLDDFTRFNTLEETIVEIIANVLVKKRKGQYKIQIRENNHFFIDSDDEPLCLVDNILVENSSDLFNYDVKKIQNIGISRSEYYIGPKKYQGIFSIKTKESDYTNQQNTNTSIKISLDGPIPLKEYYFQDYSKSTAANKTHIADFRQQLLWLPNFNLKENNSIEFYTSDNTGTFEIAVEGFSLNGDAISLKEYIYIE
ncbi:hypothetical protein GH721_13320 [Kriegella sp. EG-1]|nr:hypothetical protein [Flavobacteriaceae bacterium EG-1]